MNPSTLIRRLAVCLALAAAIGGTAHAQDGSEPLSRLRAVAEQAVRRQLPPTADVSADALDARLRLPACAQAPDAAAVDSRGARVSVTLRCNAPQTWTLYVPVAVRDLREVPVLTRAVHRGDRFDPGALRTETRDVAQLPFGYLDQYAADPQAYAAREFRRPLAAGQVPGPDDLAAERCVRRGDLVTLTGRAGSIEVRIDGKALADGARGDRIQVQNARSKRIVTAIVTGPGAVETVSDAPPKVPPDSAANSAEMQSSRMRAMTSKINGSPVQAYIPASRTTAPAGTAGAGKTSAVGAPAAVSDSVSLTDNARLMQEATALASASSGVDTEKVDSIRKELQSGSYRVDPQAIAAKLMKSEAEIYG